jgi:Activator of Hsp90 ATPase homolog 1-like protein
MMLRPSSGLNSDTRSITPQKSLKYTHYSPASGKLDAPENYQTVSVTLKENVKGTTIELSSDNNASEEEKEMTEKIWAYYLQGLKIIMDKK